jgi:hypothetical protein
LHDLIPLDLALPGTLTTAEIDATIAYAEAEKALATREAYAFDWRDFTAWCASRGATALPAHMGIVAAYLSGLADSGRKASTIGRRAAAIGYHHKIAGHEPPTGSEGVKAVLRGIRRTIRSAKQGKAPATADLIGQMLALCPDTMIGKRDRALLCCAAMCGGWTCSKSTRERRSCDPASLSSPGPSSQRRSCYPSRGRPSYRSRRGGSFFALGVAKKLPP